MFIQHYLSLIFFVFSLLLGALLPIGIIHGKSNVRNVRSELLDELDEVFGFTNPDCPIASFELIKYKYSKSRNRKEDKKYDRNYEERRLTSTWLAPFYHYKIPLLLFSAITTVFIFISLISINEAYYGLKSQDVLAKKPIFILTFTFIGGYLWSVQYLIRRVANFDLSPLSFYRCLLRIILGLAVMATLYNSAIFGSDSKIIVALAFLVGVFPTLFIDYMIAKFPSLRIKRTNTYTKELYEELPLDIIIGIDAFMKFRLEEMEIVDVQNLAAMNPLQLFIETPYGLYQVIDWVAQAQLILAVGTEKTVKLRRLNVRTIFDLEKMIDSSKPKKQLLDVLANGDSSDEKNTPQANQDVNRKDNNSNRTAHLLSLNKYDHLEVLISIIRDDLHVKRLRQIWEIIENQVEKRPYDKINNPSRFTNQAKYRQKSNNNYLSDSR